MKRDEREKNKKSGFKRSCKFERNRSASKKVVKARPLTLEDSPEQKMQDKVPERTPPDKEFIPNLPYFDHVCRVFFSWKKIFDQSVPNYVPQSRIQAYRSKVTMLLNPFNFWHRNPGHDLIIFTGPSKDLRKSPTTNEVK